MARAARCLESPALCDEVKLRGRIRSARSLGRRPIILIGVGVIALLLLTGHINAGAFWSWYGHWWPLLLIGAGLAMLVEWALDMRRKTPVRRGGSLWASLSCSSVGTRRSRMEPCAALVCPLERPERGFLQLHGPAGARLRPAGAQRAGSRQCHHRNRQPSRRCEHHRRDSSTIQVQAHEMAYANSDADAKKIFDAEAAHLTVNGNSVWSRQMATQVGGSTSPSPSPKLPWSQWTPAKAM